MKKAFTVFAMMVAAFFAGRILTQPQTCGASCFPQSADVNPQEFQQRINQGNITILDVRTPAEFSAGHIANAINLDFYDTSQFSSSLDKLDKNRTYLIYCRSGNRSAQAMKLMKEKGFTSIFNLSGGIQSWQNSNLVLVK